MSKVAKKKVVVKDFEEKRRVGGPRSKPVLFVNTGKIYRDAKACYDDLASEYPSLKYADIIQRCRGGTWPALTSRLEKLDFKWVKDSPFDKVWDEEVLLTKKLNERKKSEMSDDTEMRINTINKMTADAEKKRNVG